MMDSTNAAAHPAADFRVRDDVDEVWRLYYGQRLAHLDRCREHIHSMYCRGLELLNLPRERMPCMAQLNAALRESGWSAVQVDGVISETHLAELLQACQFPVAGNVRSLIDLHHSPEPDALHDIIGHLPLLFSTDYTCFLQTWSYRVLAASEGRMVELVQELQTRVEQVEKCEVSDVLRGGLRRHLERLRGAVPLQPRNVITLLSRLYLWTVEFGLLMEDGIPRICGAAIMSSPREMDNIVAERANLKAFGVEVCEQDIDYHGFQRQFYIAASLADWHAGLLWCRIN